MKVAYLNVFQTVLLADTPQHVFLAALLHFSGEQQLVQDEVCLLEIENDVQLADVAVVFIHLLDVAVDDFKADQLVVGCRAAGNEEERRIATVDYLLVCRRQFI